MTQFKADCAHHGPLDDVRPGRGLCGQIRRWIQQSGNKDRAVHWPDSFELNVPARGDGYEFLIVLHFTWCVTGKADGESLVERAQGQRTTMLERVALRVREISRRYAPYEAAEAEAHIHRVIGDIFTRTHLTFASPAGVDGDARGIEHRTVLRLDGPVRDAQRAAWSRRQTAVNDHDLARLLAGQLSERRRMWREFLREGEDDWRTPYALSLAVDPKEVSEVVREMFADRRNRVEEMAEQLVEQSEGYETKDAFEIMTKNETVLRRMMAMLGIPELPAIDPSPYDDDGSPG
ncbi:MAG TPA: hypothetical protein VF069_09485 [Streptosporangiaceae bacterium]